MIFNAIQTACEMHPAWEQFRLQLRDINKFLRDQEMRLHFSVRCLAPVERAGFENWSRDLVDWKWEHMSQFLKKVVEVLGVLRNRFDIMRMGSEKEWKDDFALIKRLRESFNDVLFEGYLVVVKAITVAGDRRATWCEGCACHGEQLRAGEQVVCGHRGRRGSELAAYGIQA